MLVFTDEWINEIRHQYRQHQDYERPRLYFVATDPRFQLLRDRVEAWVAVLPRAVHHDLARRFRTEDSFTETYNTLAVGAALRDYGFEPEYERPFGTLTPDWYVPPREDIPAFIMEVFSDTLSPEQRQNHRRVTWLLHCLEQIPLNVLLHVEADETQPLPEPQLGRKIATQVQHWLMNGRPTVGASLQLNGLTITLDKWWEGLPHAVCIGPGAAFWVDKESLRRKIKSKLRKYGLVALEHRLALVIAAVLDPFTGLGVDSFLDVMLGQEIVNVSYDRISGDVVSHQWGRKVDGVMRVASRQAALSVGMMVEVEADGRCLIRALHNPAATYPLPGETFLNATGQTSHITVDN